MRIIDIIDGTTVDGPGFRTSIYFAGCAHACPGCHNPQTWSFDAGTEMTLAQVLERVDANDQDVTLSGGDPMYRIPEILPLCRALRQRGRTIWVYTGFTFDQLLTLDGADQLLPLIEVVVDGPFVQTLRDTSLLFRGSSNQRLIDVARTLQAPDSPPALWQSPF